MIDNIAVNAIFAQAYKDLDDTVYKQKTLADLLSDLVSSMFDDAESRGSERVFLVKETDVNKLELIRDLLRESTDKAKKEYEATFVSVRAAKNKAA